MENKVSITEMVRDELISLGSDYQYSNISGSKKWEIKAFTDFSKSLSNNTFYFSSREILKIRRLMVLLKGTEAKHFRKKSNFEITIPAHLLPKAGDKPLKNGIRAYLRGAFLASGNANIDGGNYHLEIISKEPKKLFESFTHRSGLHFKGYSRRGRIVYYLNSIDDIISFLTLIEAVDTVLYIYDTLLRRRVRNQTQVLVNYDLANTGRSSRAAQKQLKKIEELRTARLLEKIPSSLREIAEVRCNNPDYTLVDIARSLNLTKSGANNRIRRLLNWKCNQD
ncbi:MAG: putative sporulation transcription regulator WhiA [candidate division WS2 bacterium]|nr:putative sporulation transcription regulator WhiA [Candidatus Lithacetigena glycinireducens]